MGVSRTIPRAFADWLWAQRRRRRWTLRDVSDRSGICLGYVSDIECGKKSPRWDVMLAIAAAFDVGASDLLRLLADRVDR